MAAVLPTNGVIDMLSLRTLLAAAVIPAVLSLGACSEEEPPPPKKDGRSVSDAAVDSGTDAPLDAPPPDSPVQKDAMLLDEAPPGLEPAPQKDSKPATDRGTGLANDTCANPELLTWSGSKIVKQVDTTAAADDQQMASSCTGDETLGPDVFYKLTLPAGSYQVVLLSTTTDPALYVLSSCSPNACVAGSDEVGAGVQETVTLKPATTTTYIIGVDGYEASAAGVFTLEIRAGGSSDGGPPPDQGHAVDSKPQLDGLHPDSRRDASVRPDLSVLDGSAAAPKVVITEIMINPSKAADTSGEWFELYNAGGTAVNLKSWRIADAPGSSQEKHTVATDVLIQPGKYVVLGRSSTKSVNGGVTLDYAYGNVFNLANTADEILLYDDKGALVDKVEYGAGWTVPDGASISLKSISVDNNVAANWCTESSAWSGSAGDKGTPGAAKGCP